MSTLDVTCGRCQKSFRVRAGRQKGQIFGVDDEGEDRDLDIDNFATGLDPEDKK